MNVLAFGAHPDDIEIGCGGALLIHHRQGDGVIIVDVTDGSAGSSDTSPEVLADIRAEEGRISAGLLGAHERIGLKYPDGRIHPADTSLVISVGRLIREHKPDIVYVHHTGDSHPDHQAVASVVIDGCRRAATAYFPEMGKDPHRVSEIRVYEVWTPLADPLVFIDISSVIDEKLEAIRMHKSQLLRNSYDEIAKGLNRYRSISLPGSQYAEVFGLVRPTW